MSGVGTFTVVTKWRFRHKFFMRLATDYTIEIKLQFLFQTPNLYTKLYTTFCPGEFTTVSIRTLPSTYPSTKPEQRSFRWCEKRPTCTYGETRTRFGTLAINWCCPGGRLIKFPTGQIINISKQLLTDCKLINTFGYDYNTFFLSPAIWMEYPDGSLPE
jgi:hypothetical protein